MALSSAEIASRYGQALFDVAESKDITSQTATELVELQTVITEQPDLLVFFASPQITKEAKNEMLQSMQTNASQLVKDFLQMLSDYGRLQNVIDIIDEFNRLNDEKNGTVRVKVTTAIELDDEQKAKLSAKFAQVVGANKVVLEPVVDEEIIGGVVLRSRDNIYDGSVKSKIDKIKRLLLN
ncbi:ATP synthase delta chain [Ligilactobacillus acidipiscis DSM 15836]|uniref:ATP synthase subunit delta n=2 Tax=Ligilactobacillus acidipiscis TaxID=89059 RepID=A0A0R2K4Q5_9LACO|nr:ATP synthase F1 subunit delta [Ligilactobacillus acidipiscis]KRM28222.1 ATP synthase delta chain [Ligilactobacillus acidipiscis DSM 15836]KRN84574.1 ATP synthase delta chain [Ligilactobacillus acidipiscis]SFV40895.1 ATP synthase delta chain [Ligilactobacillus acidipiscis]GAW64117.1 F0F1 ATP synthase subunit delta [Ligilactobacillus acidipiscis]GEN21176.1 ATP synthase subunit delta [Ligilactobacillus acidipiscis]